MVTFQKIKAILKKEGEEHTTMITCSECGEYKTKHYKNLCSNCYFKTKSKTKKIKCSMCGEQKTYHAKNKCRKCYLKTRYQMTKNSSSPISA